jgi:hypothetical protein
VAAFKPAARCLRVTVAFLAALRRFRVSAAFCPEVLALAISHLQEIVKSTGIKSEERLWRKNNQFIGKETHECGTGIVRKDGLCVRDAAAAPTVLSTTQLVACCGYYTKLQYRNLASCSCGLPPRQWFAPGV